MTEEGAKTIRDRDVAVIIKHPNYSYLKKKNDIALIKVTERIAFTEFIRPACLQTNLEDEKPDVKLIVTGWGIVSTQCKL